MKGHNCLTEFFLTLLGVQQGAILSPYLFALYLNDLPDILNMYNPDGGIIMDDTNVMLLMYADDVVAMSETIEGSQNTLDLMYVYCIKWKLTVNSEKSNILVCKPFGAVSMDEVWFWGDAPMAHCQMYKYLGITFTRYDISDMSINILNNQAKKSLVSLWSGMNAIGTFPPAAALKIFHISIVPILHYTSEVWGYMIGYKTQLTLNSDCKNILGVKSSTSNAAVAGELGQFPLIILRKINMLIYWLKRKPGWGKPGDGVPLIS